MFFLKDLPSKQMAEIYADTYVPGQTDKITDALNLMRTASILVRSLDKYFAANGLSQLQFLILIVIDRELDRDWLYLTELSDRLDVSKPVITRTVSTLINNDFIVSKADKNDGRAKRLFLTPAGADKLKSLLPEYYKILVDFMSDQRHHELE